MKNSTYTRFTSIVLVIGFFVSCSTSKFNVDSLIENENYDQALFEIKAEIDKSPSAKLYFQKGKLHGLIAREREIENRTDQYELMISSFDSVKVMETEMDETFSNEADSIVQFYWKNEHQNGLRQYQVKDERSTTLAISHFLNAITLKPNSAESYKSLSIAYYRDSDIDNAISILKKADELSIGDSEVYENLGFLYLEIGNAENSIINYQKAGQDPAESKDISYGLVNAYISQGQTSQAVTFLELLVDKYPNDSNISNVLGTQLYVQVEPLFNQLIQAYKSNDSVRVTNLRVEIEGISEESEKNLISAYQTKPDNVEYLESLAVFYNNMSWNYFSVLNSAFDSDIAGLSDKALELTDFAIDYYKKLEENSESDYTDKINSLQSLKNSWTNEE